MGTHLDRAGAVHDSGAGAVLRRHGPGQERARHAHAELLRDGDPRGPLGGASSSAWRSATPANGGWIGNLDYAFLHDVGIGASPEPFFEFLTIPFVLFCAFQMTFAIITPALITGATADRLKFSAYAVFISIWLVLVYAPVAHWVFAGGWLAEMGALDFAGGAVVHINAGAAALALVLVLGQAQGLSATTPMPPHNLPMTMIGTGILWFGWAGFNAGSALAANGVAAVAIMNTFLAASAAMLGWLVVERIKEGKATTLGAASGAVAGLVAITPCAGFVGGMAPIYIGALAG